MIYFVLAEGIGHIKIGFTASDDVAIRIDSLQTGSPVPLRLLGTIPGSLEDEKDLHRRFASARVHGEWFRPDPELMALINPAEALECGGVSVANRSVQIRVLTVGRKQFSKTLFIQLPWGKCIDWFDLFLELEEAIANGGNSETILKDPNFDLSKIASGNAWGWVRVRGETFDGSDANFLIFEDDEQLMKQLDRINVPDHEFPPDFPAGLKNKFWEVAKVLYVKRKSLPGWSDQLFIGV